VKLYRVAAIMLACFLLATCASTRIESKEEDRWVCLKYRPVPQSACECRRILVDATSVGILSVDILADLETGKMTAMVDYYPRPVENATAFGVVLITFKAFPHVKEIYMRYYDRTISHFVLKGSQLCVEAIIKKEKKDEPLRERRRKSKPGSSTEV